MGPRDAQFWPAYSFEQKKKRKHWRRVEVHSITTGHVREGSHIPPPLLQFVATAPAEGAPTSEAEQQQFLAVSPWRVDSELFESVFFEPPDDPTTSFA